jgi:uncharacterized protein (TIGR01777 family)
MWTHWHRNSGRDGKSGETLAMNVLVSGASGLIGRAFVQAASAQQWSMRRLVRGHFGERDASWNPETGEIQASALDGIDAVVHLAGEPLLGGRWSEAKKRRIVQSRENGTRGLAEAIARAVRRPLVMLSASATGIYGSRGDELLTEVSSRGTGFLVDVCHRWERSTVAAEQAGVRVVHLRIGVVLDNGGGALRTMLPTFRAGLGGRLGSGTQWMSWITLEDVIRSMEHAIADDSLRGPVNIVSPHAVTNAELTATLARVLGRPAALPVPAWALRLALGEIADEAVLASARVMPERLIAATFEHRHPDLEGALRAVLARPRSD